MVAAARQTLRRRKVGQPALVIQGAAQHLPFSDMSFDTVISTFPSEYIYDPDTISEVERVLRHGGRLIVIEGANLLPIGPIQPLLVLIQALVYGPSALFGPRKQHNLLEEVARSRYGITADEPVTHTRRDIETGLITEVLPQAWFGQHIPLEQCGLQRRSERVRSKHWEVYIIIGEKK
jgi:SAM-dependent methyltransferase